MLKKRTEASVKEAVRKFESAKRCYKVNRDQQGVQNCDEQITACKQILNYFTQQTAKVTAEESYEFPEAGGEQIIPVKRNEVGVSPVSMTGARPQRRKTD